MNGTYVNNLETGKLELHFLKADYVALDDAAKGEIKSRFLFSGRQGCWVSRSTHSHYWPLDVAKKLGLTDGGTTGEKLSFAEQEAAKVQRAGERAERMEIHAENAEKRAEAAFDRADLREEKSGIPFGQPILVGHHSESRHRRAIERADNAMRKGIEESDKAKYFVSRAENARYTASQSDLTDKRYLQNRIDENEAQIRDYDRRMKGQGWIGEGGPSEAYNGRLAELRAGYQEKLDYFRAAIKAIGGVTYSRDNVKPGDMVKIRGRWELVVKCNGKTIASTSGVFPWPLKHSWAEVQEHKPKSEQPAQQPAIV